MGDTPVSIAFQHVSGDFIKPSSLNPELPEGINILLAVALAKKPVDRYQSAAEMLSDVRKLRAGQVVKTKIARAPINRGRLALVAGLVIVLGGGFAFGIAKTGSTQSNTLSTLPNVVGLTESDARSLLSGYTVTIQHSHDGRIPKGRVASQVPLPTSMVKKNSGVILTLSDGPGDATVPTGLVGMSLIDARASLTAAGLVIAQTNAVPSDKPQGTVLEVDPAEGSVIAAGSGVTLQIASGDIEVPVLVGVDEIQARTELVQAGFLVNEIQAYDANQPVGVVLAQAPQAGSTHTIGSSVTITVNTAP